VRSPGAAASEGPAGYRGSREASRETASVHNPSVSERSGHACNFQRIRQTHNSFIKRGRLDTVLTAK
jgi:hypothetical protein